MTAFKKQGHGRTRRESLHKTPLYNLQQAFGESKIEILCRRVIQTVRSLLSKKIWFEEDWPAVTSSIQTSLNNWPPKRFGVRNNENFLTPFEVMTGIQRNRGTKRYLMGTKTIPSQRCKMYLSMFIEK